MGAKAPQCTTQNFGPIGTGPFKAADFKANDTIRFVANDKFRDPDKPAFASIYFKGGGDAASAARPRRRRIIFRHVLPNVLSPIMVSATLGVASAIVIESALSFLGLGFPPDFPTWGRLLFDGANFMTLTPARVIWPGLAISLTVHSVNFIGEGLRDALDPRLRD